MRRLLWMLCHAALAVMLLSLANRASAEDHILSGLASEQVLQRRADGTASATIHYEPRNKSIKKASYQILDRGLPLDGMDWTSADKQKGGGWAIKIESLPTGGPYEILIEGRSLLGNTLDEQRIGGVFVGDLWVLAGQSNMEGVGKLEGAADPIGLVHLFDMSDNWRLASEPLHERALGVHPIYWNVGEPSKAKRETGKSASDSRKGRSRGAGLGLAFAGELSSRTGVPIGLLPCAYGGTSMDQWNPDRKSEGSYSLYGAMIRRIEAAGGSIKGVVWYQAESETGDPASGVYEEKMTRFIAAIRKDVNQPDLPFYLVQIGRWVMNDEARGPHWEIVRDVQRRLETQIPHVGVATTIDLALDDQIHIDTAGLKVIGRRMATLALIDLFPAAPAAKNLKRGPRFKEAIFEGSDRKLLRVRFDGVNGRLVSAGRASGFAFAKEGAPLGQPYKVMIDPAQPDSVLFLFQDSTPEGTRMYYGRGTDPYCNLADEAGFAVLGMGPVPLP